MKKIKKNIPLSFLLVVIFFVFGFFLIKSTHVSLRPEDIKSVQIAGKEIKVELALTQQTQEAGLSGRKNLDPDAGMFFIFNKPDKYYFWMKDMNFPIDMIWIGENMKVIYVKKNADPKLYPESYGPSENSKYVLEVVAGFSDKNNLKIGDSVSFK